MDDRENVVGVYRKLLEAWNKRDAHAFADRFTPDGTSIGFDGSEMTGRAEIHDRLSTVFADHPTAAYVARLRELRSLGSSVVLLRAVVGMVPPGGAELNPMANAVQSVLFTTDSNEPLIALFQNTPAAYHGRPHLVEELTAELSEVFQSGKVVIG